MTDTIELWAERGIPRTEIIKRIRERNMRDCVVAQQWLRGIFTDEMMRQVCEMADHLRSTAEIFSFMPFGAGNDVPDSVFELMALCTEAYVRAADETFPKASKN